MPRFFLRSFIVFLAAVIFFCVNPSLALEDDGFGSGSKIESQHFTIFYASGLDAGNLARSLNITAAETIISGPPKVQNGSYGTELAGMLDTLFAQVCDILDMQLYSFHGKIKICKDYGQLKQIYYRLFDKELAGRYSFYVYSLNTIYISSEHFKREILGHEMGHAIISHYFVVLPSVKIQEVLATYVEYQLRRFSQ